MTLGFYLYRYKHRTLRWLRQKKRYFLRHTVCRLKDHDWRDSSGWHGHTETCNRCKKFKWIERSKNYRIDSL